MAESDPASDALCDVVYGLSVVGSISADGEPNGMTANWMSQVSFDPRIFAVAIQETAHTRKNIDETGVFSISVLPEGSKDLSLKFTAKSTSGEGRLEGEPVTMHAPERRCWTRPRRGSSAGSSRRTSLATTWCISARWSAAAWVKARRRRCATRG